MTTSMKMTKEQIITLYNKGLKNIYELSIEDILYYVKEYDKTDLTLTDKYNEMVDIVKNLRLRNVGHELFSHIDFGIGGLTYEQEKMSAEEIILYFVKCWYGAHLIAMIQGHTSVYKGEVTTSYKPFIILCYDTLKLLSGKIVVKYMDIIEDIKQQLFSDIEKDFPSIKKHYDCVSLDITRDRKDISVYVEFNNEEKVNAFCKKHDIHEDDIQECREGMVYVNDKISYQVEIKRTLHTKLILREYNLWLLD